MNRRDVIRLGLAAGFLPLFRATPSTAQALIYSHAKLREFWAEWDEFRKAIDPASDLHNVGTFFMQAMSAKFGGVPVAFIRDNGFRVTFTGVSVRSHVVYAEFESEDEVTLLHPDGAEETTTEIEFPIWFGEPV